ncbi:hypothetical protein CLU79DRAFT_882719 [Phycomyces nitens]|nr:hypothetical protein CLU79DRAFT_882719 [Phycomyces nitens]
MENQTSFENEYDALMDQAFQGFDQLQYNMNLLNKNLETLNAIGREFQQPAKLWETFHRGIAVPAPFYDYISEVDRFDIIDSYAIRDLSNNVWKMLPRIVTSVVAKVIPAGLLPAPQKWAVRDDE